jgi:hypothetical protein
VDGVIIDAGQHIGKPGLRIDIVAPCVWPALRRAVRPLPDSCGAANTGYLDDRIVARSMSSAGGIYYLALRDFGALMIEKMSD